MREKTNCHYQIVNLWEVTWRIRQIQFWKQDGKVHLTLEKNLFKPFTYQESLPFEMWKSRDIENLPLQRFVSHDPNLFQAEKLQKKMKQKSFISGSKMGTEECEIE